MEKKVNSMQDVMGLLRLRIKRGIDLAIRDVSSSDPYVIVRLGKQKLKTRMVKKCLNPEWNEDLTLCVSNPDEPVKLFVYDHDTFSFDDKMGDAEFDLRPFLEVVKLNMEGIPSGTVISKVKPKRQNCLAEESCVMWKDGKVSQNMFLSLRNVERGEIELQIEWVDIPGSLGL